MKLRRFSLIQFAGMLFLSSLFLAPNVHASTGLSIQPVKIDQTINPGDELDGKILLTNVSDGPVDISVSLQDFVPTADSDAIQFIGRTEGVTSVVDWIKVKGKQEFSMKQGESMNIPYTVTAPANAEPGSHLGVILFKASPAGPNGGSLKVGTQVGTLVLIAIPGSHLEKGEILDFTAPIFQQGGPIPFSIVFKNTGTVHFEPKGSIVIRNMFGEKVGEVPVTGQVALPTSIKTLTFAWHVGAFGLGRYTALATIYDGDHNALTSKEISFWILPIWYILGFLVTLVLVYFLMRFIKRHVHLTIQ